MSDAIEELIEGRRYEDALKMANDEVRRHPGDHRLLNRCADIFLLLRKEDAAAHVLQHVADREAAAGAPAKAVAALKKMQGIGRGDAAVVDAVASRIRHEASNAITQELDMRPLMEGIGNVTPAAGQPVVEKAVPSPLFENLSRDELLAFIEGLQLQVFDAGDIIVAEGDPGDSLFILTSGTVRASVRDGDRRYLRVRTLHDPDFFGEISILTGGPRTATITAASRCELLELDRTTLDAITAAHPRVAEVMRRFQDERLASDRSIHEH